MRTQPCWPFPVRYPPATCVIASAEADTKVNDRLKASASLPGGRPAAPQHQGKKTGMGASLSLCVCRLVCPSLGLCCTRPVHQRRVDEVVGFLSGPGV